ncbi:hypothetical protein [Sinorhizobium medicae]
MFEFSGDYQFKAIGDERPNVVIPHPAPRCKLAIRKDTGDWFVATGVYFKPVDSLDGTTFRDLDGGIWQLLAINKSPAPHQRATPADTDAAQDEIDCLRAIALDMQDSYLKATERAEEAVRAANALQIEVDRLLRELEEARKALEPFAKIGGYMRYTPPARSVSVVYMAVEADGISSHGSAKATVADFRSALSAWEE